MRGVSTDLNNGLGSAQTSRFSDSPAESGQPVQNIREKAILYFRNAATGGPNNDIARESKSPWTSVG